MTADKPDVRYLLAVIEQDIREDPDCVALLSTSHVALGVELTKNVTVSDDDEIPNDVTL